MDGMKTMLDIEMLIPPPQPDPSAVASNPNEPRPDTSDTTSSPLLPGKAPSPPQPPSAIGDADAAAQKRSPLTYYPNHIYQTPSTFRAVPKKPRYNHQLPSTFSTSNGNGSSGSKGGSEERQTQDATQTQRQSAYGLAPGAALTYDSFWSAHGTGSGRSTPTPLAQTRALGGSGSGTSGIPAPQAVRGRSFVENVDSTAESGKVKEGASGAPV